MRTWKRFLSFILVFAILVSFQAPASASGTVSGEITNTIFPTTMVSGSPTAFRMNFKNTGNTGWTFIAAMTIRYPDGHDVDYGRIPSYAAVGSNGAATWSLSLPPGNYRVIFGLWRDEQTALTRSYWMDFTVSAPPVVSPPPVTNPPPVVPPVVTPPVTNPPPVTPPITPPPPQANISGEITNTIFPSYGKIAESISFRLDIKNTGNTPWNFLGALTIRTPDGSNFDREKISVLLNPGEVKSVSWNHSFHYAGEFNVIFGAWKDDRTPLVRSSWMTVTVSGGAETVSPPPVVPPVVTPPSVTNPPPVTPPITPPPPQANISGEITNTIFPTTMAFGNPAAFRMDFKNTGNTSWTFVAAMTIRYPDGHDVDYERIPSYAAVGSNGAATWSLSLPPGNYRVIFGLWRDEQTALTRSYWMDFTVSAPPVVSPPPVTNPPPVVPPVVNHPVITPPPVTPPVIAPPVVSPPSAVPPSTNPRITATSIPSVVTVGNGFVFRMHFAGIPADDSYEAAATIRPVGRQNEDWEKIPLRETAGMVQWYRTFHVTGDFEIIFGIWRDGIPIDRTEWTPLKSLTEEQVFGPSPTTRPTVVDVSAIPTSITSPPTEKPVVKEDPIISAEITETRLDLGDWPAFTMSFKNTGDIRHDFFAAMTIKLPDGSVINYGRKEVSLDPGISGKAAWYPLFFPGKYQVIFGIWKGDTPIANSGWIVFKVQSDPSVSDPDDMDGTAEYNPNYGKVFVPIPIDEVISPSDDADDANLAVESWEEIQEKSYQAPFMSRYVYLSPRTHFLFDHQPAVSPNEALITRKTHGLMVSASGMDYYPIDLISSLGGTVRYEGNFIALQLGENEALLDLDSQTVIADNDVYPIDPIWHRSDIAITADSVNLPTGFYRGFFGIHPARMSITQEDTAYAEEFGNAHDEGPALIRDWVIGSVFGHFIGKAAIILVSRAASAIATKFLVTGLSREAAVIATIEAERAVVSGMAKTVLSRLPRATSYEVSLAVEKRLFTKMAEATGEKAQKGILGEINLVRAFRKMGIDIHPDFIHLGHGFDNVGTMGERIVVGEAKYVSEGLFRLSNLPTNKSGIQQMSKRWIDYASGLLRDSGKAALADGINTQLKGGTLKKILVITRPSGKVYGVEDAVLDLFDVVIEVDLSGLELARYLR